MRFIKKIFLLPNISPNIVFKMSFFILNKTNIDFWEKKLWWKLYTTKKYIFIIERIKFEEKKIYIAVALNLKYETLMIYIILFDGF